MSGQGYYGIQKDWKSLVFKVLLFLSTLHWMHNSLSFLKKGIKDQCSQKQAILPENMKN